MGIGRKARWTGMRSHLPVLGYCLGSLPPWGSTKTGMTMPMRKQVERRGGDPPVGVNMLGRGGHRGRLTDDRSRQPDPALRSSLRKTGDILPMRGILTRKSRNGTEMTTINLSGLLWPTTLRCLLSPDLLLRSRCCPRTAYLGIHQHRTIRPPSSCSPTYLPRPSRPSRCQTKTSQSASPGT